MLQRLRAGNYRAAVGDIRFAAIVARIGKRRRVEQVEDISPKLQGLLVIYLEILEHGHVDTLVSWPENGIAFAAEITESRRQAGYVNRL